MNKNKSRTRDGRNKSRTRDEIKIKVGKFFLDVAITLAFIVSVLLVSLYIGK